MTDVVFCLEHQGVSVWFVIQAMCESTKLNTVTTKSPLSCAVCTTSSTFLVLPSYKSINTTDSFGMQVEKSLASTLATSILLM